MISKNAMTFTYTVFLSSHPGYLTSHPLQLSYYLLFIDYSTSTVFVISNHYMYDIIWIRCDITTTLSDIKRLYSWHHIHTIPEYRTTAYMSYTTFVISLPQYYDKTPTIFLTLYSVYMIFHMVNEWKHNHCISHDIQCICVIKPTWLMTSQPVYVWNHTHCMYETIGTVYDITFPLPTTHHCLYVMAHTLFMTSSVLYMMSPYCV